MEKIILFYKYVDIEYPKQIHKWLQKLCLDFGLNGRIILAHEGINGTLGGVSEHLERFKKVVGTHPLFDNIDWKESEGGTDSFPRLRIVIKDEITHLGLDTQKIRAKNGGIHLTPEETHALLSNKPTDLVVFDARNNFESAIGAFTDAIIPDIDYFRELPAYIENNLEQFRDKQVVMYCTGGIRCERASAFLKSQGVAKEVYQMEGGIHRYAEKYPDGFFRGKNYVFDGRIAVKVNDDILGSCALCTTSCDEYTNCLNASCNNHFICCQICLVTYGNTCSQECQELLQHNAVAPRPQRSIAKPLQPH
jgi:predicted sulfurtransferase